MGVKTLKGKAGLSSIVRSFFSVGSWKFYVVALILIGAGLGSFNGYREIKNASPMEYRGKIKLFNQGKSEAIGIFDSNNQKLFSCNSLNCGYEFYKNDVGKNAIFIVKNELVVEISVDGVKKLTEEMAGVRNDGKRFFGVMLLSLGFFFIVIGVLESRSHCG